MNSTIERWRSQSPLMCASVSSCDGGITPCLTAESCIARSESPKVVSRSETDPSRNVSSLTATLRECTPPPGASVAERRRVPELAELRRAAAEEEPDRPVGHQARPPAGPGHEREVVG